MGSVRNTHRANIEKGEIPPLGAIPIVSALTMYLKGKTLLTCREQKILGGWGSKSANQNKPDEKGPSEKDTTQKEELPLEDPGLGQLGWSHSLYPSLDPFGSTS